MGRPSALDPPCSRCGGPSSRAFDATDRNRQVAGGSFRYQRCEACGVVWLPDIPEDLAGAYPVDYHAFPEGEDLAEAVALESSRIALIRRHVSAGRLVEIGPSQGIFAIAAREAGFDVTGLEMDPECCRHLEEDAGVRAIQTADPAAVLDTLPPSHVVALWHVIEHVPDPWRTLAAIARNLEPGGVLALATPNPRSFGARLLGRRWVHVDAPRHLTLIPFAALRDAAAAHGLEATHVTTVDPYGLILNRMSWERSLLKAPTLRDNPRLAYTRGHVLAAAFAPIERGSLRGAAYTAVFRKPG